MFQPVWQPVLLLGAPEVYLHSAERRTLPFDHPERVSTLRKALYQSGLLERPGPTDRLAAVKQDFLEDSIYTTIGASVAASLSTFHRLGGHIPYLPSFKTGNIWAIPKWASQLLHRVRLARYFAGYWAIGMTYMTSYNLLTGFLGVPVNELHHCQPQAAILSTLPAAFVYAALQPNGRPERLWFGRTPPLVGRFFLAGTLGMAVAVFNAKRFARTSLADTRPQGADSYLETLQINPPSADVVADMPYIPYHKTSPTCVDLPVKNPLYDPQYVAGAMAEVRRKVDILY